MFPFPYGNMAQNQAAYEQSLKNIIEQASGQLQQIQNQPQMPMQQPTNLTQNFQLASNSVSGNFKLVNDIEDVKKEVVITDTYFLANDNSQMWIKNTKGEIRTFNLVEVIQKDEKDLTIENLQKQIEELKGMMNNEHIKYDVESTSSTNGNAITEAKSTNVSNFKSSKTK